MRKDYVSLTNGCFGQLALYNASCLSNRYESQNKHMKNKIESFFKKHHIKVLTIKYDHKPTKISV